MPRYRECPSCRALLTEDQLAATEGSCPYCDAQVEGPGEFKGAAASDPAGRRTLAPLSVPDRLGGKLGTALFLLFDQFAIIAGLMLLIKLPSNIGIELMVARNPNPVDPFEVLRLRFLVDLFFSPIYMAGIVTTLANRMEGLPTTFLAAARTGLHGWVALFAAQLMARLFIFCGLLLFIVPGVVLAIRYCLIDEAVILDGASVGDSRARSTALTAGKELKILAAGVVSIFLVAFFSGAGVNLADGAGLLDHPVGSAVVFSLADVLTIYNSIVLFLYYWESRLDELERHDDAPHPVSKEAPFEEL